MANDTILVTTAGKVGAAAARLLGQRGQSVRILTRHAGTVEDFRDCGVDGRLADLDDRAGIDAAMDGVRVVILVSPAVPDQEIAVIDSARRARVAHVVKITSKSALDSPIPRRRDQARIEQALVGSGLGYTLLRNNAYAQNLLQLARSVAATSGFGSSAGDGRIGMVDTRDVAAVAAEIAIAPQDHHAATYWPTGPQALSYADVAGILSDILQREIDYRPLTVDEQASQMVDAGMPEDLARMNAQALALFAAGDSDWLSHDVWQITGRAPRSVEAFLRENAAAFDARRLAVR